MSDIDSFKDNNTHFPKTNQILGDEPLAVESQKIQQEAQIAADAAKEARACALQMEAELNQLSLQDENALAIAKEGVREAMAQAAAAEQAAAEATALWQEMAPFYQEEASRRQKLQNAQTKALQAVQETKAAQVRLLETLRQQEQARLQQQFNVLRQDADTAFTKAQRLGEQAAEAVRQVSQTEALIAEKETQSQTLKTEQDALLANIPKQEKALTQAKTVLKKAQNQLADINKKRNPDPEQVKKAEAEVAQAQTSFKEKEQTFLHSLESRAAKQKEMESCRATLQQNQTELEERRHQAAALAAAFAEAAAAASEKTREAEALHAKQPGVSQEDCPIAPTRISKADETENLAAPTTPSYSTAPTPATPLSATPSPTTPASASPPLVKAAPPKERPPLVNPQKKSTAQLFIPTNSAKPQAAPVDTNPEGQFQISPPTTNLGDQSHIGTPLPRVKIQAGASAPAPNDKTQAEAATADNKNQADASATEDTSQADVSATKSSKTKVWGSYLLCILIALVLALLVRTFFFQVTEVSGSSMEPVLQTSERLFTSKVAYWGNANPQRGDIVIVEDPANLGEPPYVKRVVAVAGDHLVIQDGQVYLNDNLLQESYLPSNTQTPGEVDTVIPTDCIFIMGDNRDESRDSRDPSISFVPLKKVSGKVLWTLYPFDQWGSVY